MSEQHETGKNITQPVTPVKDRKELALKSSPHLSEEMVVPPWRRFLKVGRYEKEMVACVLKEAELGGVLDGEEAGRRFDECMRAENKKDLLFLVSDLPVSMGGENFTKRFEHFQNSPAKNDEGLLNFFKNPGLTLYMVILFFAIFLILV